MHELRNARDHHGCHPKAVPLLVLSNVRCVVFVISNICNIICLQDRYYEACRRMVQEATGCTTVRGGSHEYRNGHGHLPRGSPGGAQPTPNGSGGTYVLFLWF